MSASDWPQALFEFLAGQARELAGNDLPPSLYHYTSAAGMQAIISSGVMRAHNLGQMNDFVEGRYAASVMRAHIDRGYATETRTEAMPLFLALRQQLTSIDTSNIFALSFTTNGDEPGMWRLYADRGRGFSFAAPILKVHEWGTATHQGLLLKCNYDPRDLDNFCGACLSKVSEFYLRDLTGGDNPDAAEYARTFLENVAWFAPAFKPAVWHDEKEWRFIFVRPPGTHKKLPDGRTFVEVSLTLKGISESPIRAICAGPDCDYDDEIVSLQRVLSDNGYPADYPVHVSERHMVRPGRRAPVRRAVAPT